MQTYVLGFLFDAQYKRVVLIKKTKPQWQAGLMNGVGGKIEVDETPVHAMVREFGEETAMLTHKEEWIEFLTLTCPKARIYCFYAVAEWDITHVSSPTEEQVFVMPVNLMADSSCHVLPNVPWMVAMAQSFARGETATRFIVTEVRERV